MKFTVEVEDFWLEEEELSTALTSKVKHSVVQQISESIKTKVEAEITKKVGEVIDEKINVVIDQVLSDLVEKQTIVNRNKQAVTIAEHLKGVFQNHNGWNSPDEKMERIAKKFGDELKLQYNNAFANKIVQNMKKQGLLKDEVVQILLGDK